MILKTFILSTILASGAFATASAETWAQHHPRQAEVLGRTRVQDARIHNERVDGKISGKEAGELRTDEHDVRLEDHADARANGGYITKGQQAVMNKQENQIRRDLRN